MMRVRLLEIEREPVVFRGICVDADTYDQVIEVAHLTKKKFDMGPAGKTIEFRVIRKKSGDDLSICFGDLVGSIDFVDVDPKIADSLQVSMQQIGFFFVMLTYGENSPIIVPPATFHLVSQCLIINEREVQGRDVRREDIEAFGEVIGFFAIIQLSCA